MFIKQLFRLRQSVYFSWLLSYFLILLVPTAISTVTYIEEGRMIEKEINQFNRFSLGQVQHAIDRRLQEVESLCVQLALDPRIQGLIDVKGPLLPQHRYRFYEVMKNLGTYKLANTYVEDYYIYLRATDTILSPTTHAEPGIVYNNIHQYHKMEYEEWYQMIRTQKTVDFVPMVKKTDTADVHKIIAYLRPLPIERPREPFATLVILIDILNLQEAIEDINWATHGNVLILDSHNRIVASTRTFAQPFPIGYENLEADQEILHSQIDGQKVVISYVKSQVADWKYINIIPTKVFTEKASYVRNLTIISLMSCLLIGGLVAYFLLRRNYNPIQRLVQTLKGRPDIPSAMESNEYRFIQEVIDSTLDAKDRVYGKLKQQNMALRSSFLARLLKGRLEDSSSLQEKLSSFEIVFSSDLFAVLLFYIEDCSSFIPEREPEERLMLVQFIISNVVEELVNRKHKAFTTEVNEMPACIVNLSSADEDAAIQELCHISQEAQVFIEDKFQIIFSVSVSSIQSSVAGIPAAFQEALEAMEYRMIAPGSSIIRYSDINGPSMVYNYPISTENQLINYIKAGDFCNAERIVGQVFENNFAGRSPSIQVAKCLPFDLVGTIAKALNETDNSSRDAFLEKLKPVDCLLHCSSLKEMETYMLDMIREACEYAGSRWKLQDRQLSEDIIRFIEAHYQDANLSISLIAEKFSFTQAYLSRLFKEQTGIGLLDYINKVRLNKAKELMKDDGMNIAHIASKVGFSNSNVFIRTFKKYEGITPGKYKVIRQNG